MHPMTRTISSCLDVLSNGNPHCWENLSTCSDLQEEWTLIKKTWMIKVRQCHPDKGGSPSDFRAVQDAFEALKDVYERNVISSFHADKSYVLQGGDSQAKPGHTPSWEFYEVPLRCPLA